MAGKPRHDVDWEAVEKHWRTGQYSNRALAERYNTSESTIRARAKKEEWKKDLVEEYQKEVENQLLADYAQNSAQCAIKTDEERADDKQIISEAASVGVEVVRRHRKRIGHLNEIADELAYRLKCSLLPNFQTDEYGERNVKEVIGSNESHSDMAWKLSRITSETVKLERQAFNLDAKQGKEEANNKVDLEDRIKAAMRNNGFNE